MPCATGAQTAPAGDERANVAWLPIGLIDEPRSGHNTRSEYHESSVAEVAASIRQYGILQPLCVRPDGARYRLIFGVRRLRAARRAGLLEVPCTIRIANDDRAFVLNTLENLHRRQLTPNERVEAIARLVATGLGVREVARRTGFNPSTISRWLRIERYPDLKAAVEQGVLDIARACILIEAPRSTLADQIAEAPRMLVSELRTRIAALKRAPASQPASNQELDRLREALRNARAVRCVADAEILDALRREVERLMKTACQPARSSYVASVSGAPP